MAIYEHPGKYPGQGRLSQAAGLAMGEAADWMREAGQLATNARRDLVPTEAAGTPA
jgi:hypothetical protein